MALLMWTVSNVHCSLHNFISSYPFPVYSIISLEESSVKSATTGLDIGGDDNVYSTNIEPSVASRTDIACHPINSTCSYSIRYTVPLTDSK